MKVIFEGQVDAVALSYDAKLDAGVVSIEAKIDAGKLVEKAEAALPEGSLKPIEIAFLEMAKQSFKAL